MCGAESRRLAEQWFFLLDNKAIGRPFCGKVMKSCQLVSHTKLNHQLISISHTNLDVLDGWALALDSRLDQNSKRWSSSKFPHGSDFSTFNSGRLLNQKDLRQSDRYYDTIHGEMWPKTGNIVAYCGISQVNDRMFVGKDGDSSDLQLYDFCCFAASVPPKVVMTPADQFVTRRTWMANDSRALGGCCIAVFQKNGEIHWFELLKPHVVDESLPYIFKIRV